MTADEFRELALSLKGSSEGEHMRHPDFRAHGKVFATLGYPNAEFGMVKLALSDQKQFVEAHPQAFSPVKGAWGLHGATSVTLAAAQRDTVAQALDLAWRQSALAPVKKAAKKAVAKPATKRTDKRAAKSVTQK